MKSREEELAGKVRSYLDQAAADLRPGLAYRLQQARALALGRASEASRTAGSGRLAAAHGLVGAGAGGGNLPAASQGRPALTSGRLWLGVGLVALAVLGWQQWTTYQEIAEVEALDAQILTSDLPIDAFVDRGFRLFLEVAPQMKLPDEGAVEPAEAEPADEPAAAEPREGAPAVQTEAQAPAAAPAKPAE